MDPIDSELFTFPTVCRTGGPNEWSACGHRVNGVLAKKRAWFTSAYCNLSGSKHESTIYFDSGLAH